MKKLISVLFILFLMIGLTKNTEAQLWGSATRPLQYTVRQDTIGGNAGTTTKTCVNYAGSGELYLLSFNNDATHDATVYLTIDGKTTTITKADDEEVPTYVILSYTPSATVAAEEFVTTDTATKINLKFRDQLLVTAKSAAGGQSNVIVHYGKVVNTAIWGGSADKYRYNCVQDTVSTGAADATAWQTTVDVAGAGIIYQVSFVGSSNTANDSVRVTVDGLTSLIGLYGAGANQLTANYAILMGTPSTTRAAEEFGQSTTATRLDMYFQKQFKVQSRVSAANTTVETLVHYGKIE